MDFDHAIRILGSSLEQEQPQSFSSTWIYLHAPKVYWWIWRNVRTGLGDIDWDAVTSSLDRPYQALWKGRRPRRQKPYHNSEEVSLALGDNAAKRYVFLVALDDQDLRLRDRISVTLTRLAQMGNVSAEDELVELLGFMVGQWIERHYILRRWRGYPSDLIGILHGCIRRYRFTGTFTGYLFKTLILAGRGLPPIRFFSLDKTILDGDRRIVENVVQDSETGEISMMKRIC